MRGLRMSKLIFNFIGTAVCAVQVIRIFPSIATEQNRAIIILCVLFGLFVGCLMYSIRAAYATWKVKRFLKYLAEMAEKNKESGDEEKTDN